jgi:hypothetical protein
VTSRDSTSLSKRDYTHQYIVIIIFKLTIVLEHIQIDCSEYLHWSQSHTQTHTSSTNKFTSVKIQKYWIKLILTARYGHRRMTIWHLFVVRLLAAQTDARWCVICCAVLTTREACCKRKEEVRNEIFIQKRKSHVKLQHVSFRTKYSGRNPEK